MLSLLSEVNAAVWERSHITLNTLMTDFAQAFLNDHNNISDAVERDQSSYPVSSHMIQYMRLEKCISSSLYSHQPFFTQVKNHRNRV